MNLFAPAGTPPKLIKQMNDAVNKAVADPAVAKFFDIAAISTRAMSTTEFAGLVKRDTDIWRDIAKRTHVCLD